jgi:hypothetical protein
MGRAPGKRADDNWEKVTLLMPRGRKEAIRSKLAAERSGEDLSVVIARLTDYWVRNGYPET